MKEQKRSIVNSKVILIFNNARKNLVFISNYFQLDPPKYQNLVVVVLLFVVKAIGLQLCFLHSNLGLVSFTDGKCSSSPCFYGVLSHQGCQVVDCVVVANL